MRAEVMGLYGLLVRASRLGFAGGIGLAIAVALLAAWPTDVRAEARPHIFGCGIFWGSWHGLSDADAKEWDRRNMDLIVAMGGTNCPANFAWSDIEPSPGVFNWDYVDHQVAEAAARGLEVFAYSGLTPDWALPPGILAQYGSGSGYRFPPDEQYIPQFEAFFEALAARYAGVVKYYEFWNEPNGCSWINDGCSNGHMAHTYTPWLIRWYEAMKRGDPNCVLAVGGLDYNSGVTHGYQYIEDIYTAGGGDHFDAVAIHPYSHTAESLHWQAITDTYQVLVNHGHGHKKLWLNEYGWNTSDENYKAARITDVLKTLKLPAYDMVFQANHLILTDLPGGHNYGLCDENVGNLTITPRASYYAFQAVEKPAPEAADFSADVTAGPAPLTVQFTDTSTVADASSWQWDFGDTATSSTQNPSHTYTADGTYTVQLTVTGTNGPSVVTKTSFVRVGTFPKVAFIVGSVPTTPADAAITAHMESLGLVVDVYDDDRANRPDAATIAATHDLVVGSSTLLSVNVAGDFRHEAVPFIFWESALAWCGNPDDRECIANGATAAPGNTQIDVIDNSHPIMDGVSAGTVTLTTGAEDYSFCTLELAPGAQTLATMVGDSDAKTMIVAEPGAQLLDGGTAAALRVFLYLYDNTWLTTNATGKQIFENALAYGLGGKPAADFTASPKVGAAPLTVNFTDQSTGTVTSWHWDFGDGNTSTQRHPSHTYTDTGTCDVTLTVGGPGGPGALVRTGYITVGDCVPADFDCDGDVDENDVATFTGCATGPDSGPVAGGCEPTDIDGDGDADQTDFGVFQRCLSGQDVPPDPGCAG